MNTGDAIQEQVERASSLLTDTAEHIRKAFPSIITAILLLAAGMLIVRLITRIIGKATDRSKIDGAAKNFLISVIRVFLYVIVIVMALSVLNVPMSSILTVLGAAGLAVSLALQNCLTNLCGGFIILFSKPFSAGDTVELDGTIGNVSSIGILYTKLKTLDGKTVYIPNGKITDAKIINFTADPARRIDLTFNIAYSADFASARRIIMDVIKENKLLLSSPEPVVRMSSLNENSVTVDVLVWTANDNYFTARYDLTEGVKAAFDREGIEIPFRQLDVHLKND